MSINNIYENELIDRANQNILDNAKVNPDQYVDGMRKAEALGVEVQEYIKHRESYDAQGSQLAIAMASVGPVTRKLMANHERQAQIANELPEFDNLDFTEKVLATFKQGYGQYEVNQAMADAGRAVERYNDPVGTLMSDEANDDMDEETRQAMANRIRETFGDKLKLDALKDLETKARDLAITRQYADVVQAPKIMAQWEQAKGWEEATRVFLSDPLTLVGWTGGTSFAQQIVPMIATVPGFMLSPAIGAMATGLSSAHAEYWASIQQYAEENGVDMKDRDSVMSFLKDPEMFSQAQTFAENRAGPVGLWDAVGGLVAAATNMRFLAGTRGLGRQISRAMRGRDNAFKKTRIASAIEAYGRKTPTLSKFDTIFSQTAAGGILGGIGELSAQINAGQEVNWGDVFLEAIGEFFTMPGEIASAQAGIALNYAAQQRKAQVAQKAVAVVEGLMKVANVSTLRNRNPEEFKQVIKEMGENGSLKEVYVQASDISQELGQSIAELVPEIGQAIEKARAEGGVVTIPMDALLTTLSGDMKIIQGLKDHIRVDQNGMSSAEATVWIQENKNFLDRHFDAVLQAQLKKDSYRNELNETLAPMADQLMTGLMETMGKRYQDVNLMTEAERVRFNGTALTEKEAKKLVEDVTRQNMRMFGATFAHLSALAGMTPKQFVERFPNQVKAMYDMVEGNALNQRVSPAKFSDAAINKGLAEDHRYTRKYASVEAMKMDAEAFEKNVSIMADIAGMKQVVGRLRKPEKKAEAIIERMADNLLWIYNQMPEAIRERARLWYEGGHKSVMLWANRYGIRPRQAAAIIAAYSPQNGWFNNFTQAERTLDIYFSDARDFKADDKLNARLKELCTGADEARYETMKGKSLADLLAEGDLRSCAIWIRAYDSVFHDSRYRVQTPEGGVGNDWAKTAKGNNSRVVWMRYTPVIKALSILIDGSQANIDEQIGNDFKVRDFYNNLYDPTDEKASTIDTHQVGANLLSVMSSNSREVTQNFGGVGSAGSVITGQKGTYAFHAEALARAAERVGVLPREMQSITWEGIRVLFPDVQKKSLRPKIEAIWKRHDKGEITLDQARQEILDVTGGFGKYAWEDTPFNDVPQPSYERGNVNLVHREEVVPEPVLAIEAAPDPRNAEAVAKWDELTADEKYMVTKNVVAYVLDRVALATKTRISEVGLQVGGWLGDVNFSATAEIADGGDAVGVAKLVARLLHQQAVMVISGKKQEGMFDSKVIEIKLPDGMTPTQIGDFYKTYIDSVKNEDGKSMVMGMSTANGIMRIVLDEGDDSAKILDALSKSIEGYPGADKIFVSVSDAYVSFASGEDANGESSNSQGTSEGLAASRNDHYDSLQGQVDQYFNEQIERAKAARLQSGSQEVSHAQLDQSVLSLSQDEEESGNLSGPSQKGTPSYVNARGNELDQTIGIRGATIRAILSGNASAIREYFKAKSLDGVLSPSEIKRLTGWEKGADNKWRYEILDGTLVKPANEWPLGKPFDLKDVYNAPDLYKAYPWISGYGIGFVRDNGSDAVFDGDHNTLIVNLKKAEKEAQDSNGVLSIDDAVRKSIIHEVAHAIQRTEGFSKGTNLEKESIPFVRFMEEIGANVADMGNWTKSASDVENYFTTKAPEKVVARLNGELKRRGYASLQQFLDLNLPANRYVNSLGEVGARNDEDRADMTMDERRNKLFSETDGIAPEYKFMVEYANNELRQEAWHGSPHIFETFSTDFMGSGEGAQAHGWGLYFALNRKTAEGYRARLADDGVVIKVKNYEFDENDMSDESSDVMAYHTVAWLVNEAGPYSYGDFEEIRAEAINIINNSVTFGADKQDAAKAIELVKALTPDDVVIDGSVGRLFKVEIPNDDVMLDEDKAFKDQPEFVQKAVRELYKKLNTKRSVQETAQASVAAALVERSKIVESIQKAVADGVLEIDGNPHPEAVANSIEWSLTHYLERALNRESLPLWEYRYRQRELVVAEIGLSGSAEAINNIDFDIETLMMEAEQAFGMDHEDMPGAGSRVNLYINPEKTGSDIYDDLTTALGSPKEASLALNSVGIKGVRYDGRRDGPCAVVFDDKAVKVLEFLQNQQKQRRAAFNTSEGITKLFSLADESSFLHESGHYWLNTLSLLCSDIIARKAEERLPGEQELVEILDGFLKWAEIKGNTAEERIRNWSAMSLNEQRTFHEKFARGYEAYTRNGKAPTNALRRAFQKFKEWLMQIYRTAEELDVEMTPEVYALYDRLFMSEMEAKSEEESRSVNPLFTTAKAAGMSDDEFAELQRAYQTIHEAISAAIRSGRERNHKLVADRVEREKAGLEAEFKEMLKTARKELEGFAVYRAWAMLTEGDMIEGIQFYSKLSRGEVSKLLGGDTALIDSLQARGFFTNRSEKFVPAQILADLSGAKNAVELLTNLAEMPTIDDEAVEVAETQFLQKYGNLPTEDGLNRAAVIAMAAHDPSFSKALESEYNALAKLTGGRKLMKEGASKYAHKKIGEQKINELRPIAHARAEARAGKDAERAFKEGDLVSAAIHKRNQVLQHHIAKAGYDAQAEIQRAIKYVKKALKSKSIWGSYMVQIENLAARYGLANIEMNQNAKTLGEFLEEEEMPNGLVDEFLLTNADARPYQELTVEEFRELIDAIKMLAHSGREKNTVLVNGRKQAIKETVDSINASIEANATYQGKKFEERWQKSKPMDVVKQGIFGFIHRHIKIASWVRIMDGDKLGQMWDVLIRRANECGDRETEYRAKLTKTMQSILDPILRQGNMHTDEVVLPGANRSLTRQERIAFALNWGNDGNRQRLMDGFGIKQQEAEVILRSLTETEWRAVEQVWQVFETLRPEMEALEVRLYGRPPRWIEYSPFEVTTKEGRKITVSGGYYPAVYDFDANEQADKHEDMKQAQSLMHKAARAVATDRSHMKKRAEHVERPISLLLSNCFDALNNEVHDICWREFVIDTQRILRAGVSEQIRGYYGATVAREFQKWLQDVALGEQRPKEGCESWLSTIRQGVGIAGLGFNVVSALAQFTGLVSSTTRLGSYTGIGIGQYIRNPVEMTRYVCEQSLFMKNRGLTRWRELNEVNNLIRSSGNAIERSMDNVRGYGYLLLLKIQQIVDTITWLGAYQKALDDGNDFLTARAMADQTVIDTQGSGMVKDQSSMERGGPAMKMLTVFYSFMNTAFNLNATALMGDRNRYRATAKILTMTIVMPTIELMLRNALPVDIGNDDDDDDDKTANMIWKALGEGVKFNMGTLLGLREFASLANVVSGEPIWNYQGPGGFRLIGDTYKATQQIAQGEFDAALVKALVNLGGSMFGLPAAQINRAVSAVAEDEVDTTGELVRGALFGVKK